MSIVGALCAAHTDIPLTLNAVFVLLCLANNKAEQGVSV